MMLSIFPNFKLLEFKDLSVIEKYTKQYPPYNDFDFISLWTYNIDGKNAISDLFGNLVIKIHDFVTGEYFYSFLGTENTRETISTLIKKSEEENLGSKLRLIPEANIVSSYDIGQYFLIEEDADNSEYILSIENIAQLKGGSYHDKRNLVNRFKRENSDYKTELLNLQKEETQENIRSLFTLWKSHKGKMASEAAIEELAIEKLFDLAGTIYFIALGIYIKNKLVGFSICHPVSEEFVILSFEKGDTSFKGIYEIINNEAAKHLKSLGYKYINYEQDLGIEGLRKAKMLWRPVSFLKKYTVEKKI